MCQGQCFLKKNLALADQKDSNAKNPVSKEKLEIPVFIVSENQYRFTSFSSADNVSTHYPFTWYIVTLSSLFHPPA